MPLGSMEGGKPASSPVNLSLEDNIVNTAKYHADRGMSVSSWPRWVRSAVEAYFGGMNSLPINEDGIAHPDDVKQYLQNLSNPEPKDPLAP